MPLQTRTRTLVGKEHSKAGRSGNNFVLGGPEGALAAGARTWTQYSTGSHLSALVVKEIRAEECHRAGCMVGCVCTAHAHPLLDLSTLPLKSQFLPELRSPLF